MGLLIRATDWVTTPLGSVALWAQSLRTILSACLYSRFPMLIWWGPDLVMLYNDAYRPILGNSKHPSAMGRRGRDVWPEIWHIIGPMLEGVLTQGEATWSENQLLMLDRNGYLEECYFTFSYSPIHDESGGIGGVLTAVTETTQEVLTERRLRTLRDLATYTGEVKTVNDVCRTAAEVLERYAADIPFALLYLVDEHSAEATLFGMVHLEPNTAFSPMEMTLASLAPYWPLAQAAQTAVVIDLESGLTALPQGIWQVPPLQVAIFPIRRSPQEAQVGYLVVGLNPHRAFDEGYRGFLELVSGSLATAIASARGYEEARRQAEALAELDRAKTTFFSNVSHELRTPLTLLLAPIEDALNTPTPSVSSDALEMMHRNALRLLRLVNALLDFSRIQADRIDAVYEPVDLAAFTAELASAFRSTIESAGVIFSVDCPPLPAPVYVDRQMWEKIILNLLSNAFKFTFGGEIVVRLAPIADAVQLSVSDTGTGIPNDELPLIFERFHRVRNARSRAYEGTGIGLALVQELVKLHGGTISVTSEVGRGSTFVVTVSMGTAHLPAASIQSVHMLTSTATATAVYVEEAQRWGADVIPIENAPQPIPSATLNEQSHILIVDDNADMLAYLRRLIVPYYAVSTAVNGLEALAHIQAQRPDLVLTDVMMPELDGFGLLAAVRADPNTATLPVIMLSARAGEEASTEGLATGADDYLIKPFSARELLARISANLRLSRAYAERRKTETERDRLIEQLEAERARLHTIMQQMPSGLIIAEAPTGKISLYNDEALRIIGVPALGEVETTEDYRAYGALHPDGRSFAPEEYPLARTLMHGEVIQQEDVHYRRPNGVEIDMLVNAAPVLDAQGNIVAAVSTIIDISERNQLLKREREAVYARNEFLSVAAHELKTPITSLRGFAQILLRQLNKHGTVDMAQLQTALTTIDTQSDKLSRLLTQLLDISRLESGRLVLDRVETDLAVLIRGVVEQAQRNTQRHEISVVAPETLVAHVDPLRIEQVLVNLLDNAVKYSPTGGPIRAELRVVAGRTVQFIVSDNGIGIPEDRRSRIFERFYQAHGNGYLGGMGLGLFITQQIVELHGGQISVEAGDAGGSRFIVTLPEIS